MALHATISPKISAIKNLIPSMMTVAVNAEPTSPMLPGASLLPPSVGSKFTVRNALIGGGIALAGYLAWTFLGPKKKSSSASSPAAKAVAGLFGARRRRRRR